MGRLIPAGTGFDYYRKVRIQPDEPPPPPAILEDEMSFEGEMDYQVSPDGAIEVNSPKDQS